MYFHEFQGMKISALAAAVPDRYERIMDYAGDFPDGELDRFCKATGLRGRYFGRGTGPTASDLCVAAAEEIFRSGGIERESIEGVFFLTQSPDYLAPPMSALAQYRLGLKNCGLCYDSNLGCTAFPLGIQMACAQLTAGCERILLLVGDTGMEPVGLKDELAFGDCGTAAVIERTKEDAPLIRVGVSTMGSGYQTIFYPYGMFRHPLASFCRDRGILDTLHYANRPIMQGEDALLFDIDEAPKAAKEFYTRFHCGPDDFDLFSIHQVNQMIVEHVAKRIKAPKGKVLWSLDRYGNTRGSTTAMNICDYAERNGVRGGQKRILNLAFGIGMSVGVADITLDMSVVLPVIKTMEIFDDGVDNFSYFPMTEET